MKKTPNSKRFSVVPEELIELSQGDESSLNNFIAQDENEDRVVIRITATDVEELLPQLETFKFEVIAAHPEKNFLEGSIPTKRIGGLRILRSFGLLGVLPVYEPVVNGGLITSQADFIHESDRVRNALPNGFDGTGITVGIMSDSYDNLGGAAGDIIAGDLPAAGVNVLQDLDRGGSDEGRAMAQLVHDLAPGADLAFASVFISETDFAQQIRDLADPTKGNADVLVDDIIYFAEPFFQDGIIAQAVDDVVSEQGVTYFSSAGNSADKAFESDTINFVADSTLNGQVSYPGTYYDFDTGGGIDTSQSITLEPYQQIIFSFQWDDPFYTVDGVDTDLDLFLLDSQGNQVASAEFDNIGNQTPHEVLSFIHFGNTTETYELVISKYSGPNPGRIKYVNFGSEPVATEYPHDAPTIYGHAAAINAQAVAAVPWFDQDNPESFTSKGSTTILFNADGTPKPSAEADGIQQPIPETRNTPDIAAIDGTNTTFFGQNIPEDNDGFPNFFGTSAAAPHAAAIAALIQESDPSMTPDEVYRQLQRTAKDIHTPGHDDLTGFGLINAYDAVFGSVMTANLDFNDGFDKQNLGTMYETNSTGAGRIQVTEDYEPINSGHLVLDSSADGTGKDSLNEVILHFDATNFSNIQLSFEQKEFNDEDHLMSDNFIGSENSDGVALSIDGTNWYSLISLTETNSSNSYQNHSFNLSTIAADLGVTLGSDVQVKFQQFDDHNVDADGMAFDNIALTGDLISIPTDGDEFLVGTVDDDTIDALAGNDTVNGLSGNDSIVGSDGDDSLIGNADTDTLTGGNGNDILNGGDDNDSLKGGNGNDSLNGGNGDDSLKGGDNNDSLLGGAGADILKGLEGRDTLIGGIDHDLLTGGFNDDSLLGGDGMDTLEGSGGNDTLLGNLGDDRMFGEADEDSLLGGGDRDLIKGGNGNDYLGGQSGSDTLQGGAGEDTLQGGAGKDILRGNAGQDTFILLTDMNTADRDFIRDFKLDVDILGISDLADVASLSIKNSNNNSSSIIYGSKGQQVALLSGISDITVDDLDFVEFEF